MFKVILLFKFYICLAWFSLVMAIITEVPDNDASAMVVSENFRGRVINKDGIAAIRGGQTVDAGIFESVTASYANLVNHPIALMLAALGSFILVAETYETIGPLEIMASAFHRNADSANSFVKTCMVFLLIPLDLMISNKLTVAKLALVSVPYAAKPSKNNFIFFAVLIVVIFVSGFTVLEMFCFANLFYLFVMIRSPIWRILMVMAFMILFMGIFELESLLDSLRESHKKFNITLPRGWLGVVNVPVDDEDSEGSGEFYFENVTSVARYVNLTGV